MVGRGDPGAALLLVETHAGEGGVLPAQQSEARVRRAGIEEAVDAAELHHRDGAGELVALGQLPREIRVVAVVHQHRLRLEAGRARQRDEERVELRARAVAVVDHVLRVLPVAQLFALRFLLRLVRLPREVALFLHEVVDAPQLRFLGRRVADDADHLGRQRGRLADEVFGVARHRLAEGLPVRRRIALGVEELELRLEHLVRSGERLGHERRHVDHGEVVVIAVLRRRLRRRQTARGADRVNARRGPDEERGVADRDLALQRPAVRARLRVRPGHAVAVLEDRADFDARKREGLLDEPHVAMLHDHAVVDLPVERHDRAVGTGGARAYVADGERRRHGEQLHVAVRLAGLGQHLDAHVLRGDRRLVVVAHVPVEHHRRRAGRVRHLFHLQFRRCGVVKTVRRRLGGDGRQQQREDRNRSFHFSTALARSSARIVVKALFNSGIDSRGTKKVCSA